MKYMSRLGRLDLVAMLLIMLMSASCGGVSKGLLDTVPASSPMVSVVDLDAVLKQAGCDVSGDTFDFTPELSSLLAAGERGALPVPVRLLSRLHGAVDMSHVVLFSLDQSGHDNVLVADMTDRDGVINALSVVAESVPGSDELDMYCADGWSVAVASDRMWMAAGAPSDLSESVMPLLSLKGSESISGLTGISDFLNSGSTVCMALRPSALNPVAVGSHTSDWSCVSVTMEDAVIGVDFCQMDGDGRLAELTHGMQEVDTDFLRYVPQSYVFAMAAGFSSDFNWQEITSAASLVLGPLNSSYVSALAPLLSKVDGTVAFAAGPASGAPAVANLGLDTWDMMLMVHMSQSDVDSALSMLQSYGAMAGIKMKTGRDNVMEATLPDGTKVYAGNVDGYLAVSNREFDASMSNAMTDIFLSKQAAMVMNIPAGSEIVKAFGMPCGFDFHVQMADDYVHGRLSLNGSDRRVFQTLIELLARK